jgi:hypothetical protein
MIQLILAIMTMAANLAYGGQNPLSNFSTENRSRSAAFDVLTAKAQTQGILGRAARFSSSVA